MEEFDALIIGTGQAASPLAAALSKKGLKTAVVERSHLGGSCVNYGCTPTKTMLASAAVSHLSKNAAAYGIHNESTRTDFTKVIQRRNKLVEEWRQGVQEGLEALEGLKLFRGEAHFSGKKEVEVVRHNGETQMLKADKIFINVGTSPRIPALEGLEDVPYYTARSIMELKELPEHLLILGGSYIGLEFGQLFHRLGSRVSIIETEAQLAGREDRDIAETILEILEEEGLKVHLEAKPARVEQQGKKITLFLENEPKATLSGTHLLLATGTSPNTPELRLEKAQILTNEQGYITVNEHLQTSTADVFALGDCKGGPEFTHISYDDFRIVNDYLFGKKERNTNDRQVPYTMFTSPELGRVGLGEREAKKQGLRYKVAKMPAAKFARARETNHTKGLVKVLVDSNTDQILGAACLIEPGGELMTALQLAMMGKLPYQQLRDGVFAHPTWAESFNNLFAELKEPEEKEES